MAQLQEQILAYLPPAVRSLLEGGSKRELLKKVDATLLVFDEQVLHVESGKSASIASELIPIDASSLAIACRSLLNDQQKEHSVLLLLAPSEFIATSQTMPGVTRESLVSALRLQAEALLPAYENSLALAVNPASAETDTTHVALWIPQNRMVELFEAFIEQGIFIAAIKYKDRDYRVSRIKKRKRTATCSFKSTVA